MTKIRTMTMESMEWYGTVHMDSMDYSMDSIWNGMEQSIWNSPWIPYGMELYQKIHQVQYEIHVHSMDWIPCTRFHGFHLDSIWNRYLGVAKINLTYIYIEYIK
jgi:hypothetical protein